MEREEVIEVEPRKPQQRRPVTVRICGTNEIAVVALDGEIGTLDDLKTAVLANFAGRKATQIRKVC